MAKQHPLLTPLLLPGSSERSGSPVGPGSPPVEHQFKPGQSGNPKGRPRGLARKVREVLGNDDGEALAGFWASVLSGRLVTIEADGSRTVETVEMKDRIAVSKLLAERGWGKPPMYAPIEDDDPLDLSEDRLREAALSFRSQVDELAARREQREAAG